MLRETDNTLACVLKLFGDLLDIFDSKSGGTGDEVTSSEGLARYGRFCVWQVPN